MYKLKIGLEIHLQLLTFSKAFSPASPMLFGKKQNTSVSEIDLGYPGTLPIFDIEFVISGLVAAHIFHMKISETLSFDRKHYLYPDLPKGFQITQFFNPLAKNGYVQLTNKKIRISDIHLEEDTAKRIYLPKRVLIDYNRCGKPLLEIVTEPDFECSSEVIEFLTWLRQEMVNASLTRGILAEGSMRCDINLSMYDPKTTACTERVEIKNLNSFKSIEDAITYEIKLHSKALATHMPTYLQTKSFDEQTRKTSLMRVKTEVEQYFYIPEPNIIPLKIKKEWIEKAKRMLPLPIATLKELLQKKYKVHEEVVNAITGNRHLLHIFKSFYNCNEYSEKADQEQVKITKTIVNWLSKIPNDDLLSLDSYDRITIVLKGKDLITLYDALEKNMVSSRHIMAVIHHWIISKSIRQALKKYKTVLITDKKVLERIIEEIFHKNHSFIIENIHNRRGRVKKMLMGQVMKQTKGMGSPQIVMTLINNNLKKFSN